MKSNKPFPSVAVRKNLYSGERVNILFPGDRTGNTVVSVNGVQLDMRLDIRNHSPTGFEWGYNGSGPAQLALAILANEYGEDIAEAWYQDFKEHTIARISGDEWVLTSEHIYYALVYVRNQYEKYLSSVERDAPF